LTAFNFTPFPDLSTPRLLLRQLDPRDENEIFTLRSDERVNLHLDRPKATSIKDARDFIEKITAGIRKNESMFWAISSREDPRLLGTICLWNINEKERKAEIGYELLPDHQRKGIMQEALSAVLAYSFGVLQLNTIEAWTTLRNHASVRILENNYFKRDAEAESKLENTEKESGLIIYTLTRDRYLSA
jgi:ribosomal-protein-alanine N-acetyltransferase